MVSTMTADDGLTLVLERDLDAPRALVWRCWTETDVQKPLEMGFEDGWIAASGQLDQLAQSLGANAGVPNG